MTSPGESSDVIKVQTSRQAYTELEGQEEGKRREDGESLLMTGLV